MNNTPQLENGFIKIANQIVDNLCKINLSAYQSRVLWFIFRKTYGYNKKEDWISVNQIVEATGLKQSHVSRAKKELLLRGLIYTPTGIKIAFQKDSRLWKDIPNEVYRKKYIPQQDKIIPQQVSNIPHEDINIPQQGDTIDNIQKTITKDTIQKKYSSIKEIDSIVIDEIASKYQVPASFVQSKLDDMTNWMAAKGKVYRDYRAALSNWVKADALKIIQKERQIVNKFSVTKV